jgi:putative ABC transport system ATP-binding protein
MIVRAPESGQGARARHAAVSTRGLTRTYGRGASRVVALDGVDVQFSAGQLHAVMGPSGSGKSTLMHCIAGLDRPTRGEVFIDGVEFGRLSDRKRTRLRRQDIGMIFQAFNLVPTLTVAENIRLPLSLAHRRPDREWYETMIHTVGLQNRLRHRPGELSGGQQQRVAIARALVGRPSIVLADEPTGNLDSRSGTDVLELIRHCVSHLGQTVIMVTHDPVAAGYADRAVILADGRIVDDVASPSPDAVLDRLAHIGR